MGELKLQNSVNINGNVVVSKYKLKILYFKSEYFKS